MRTIRLLILLLFVAFLWSGVHETLEMRRLKTEQEALTARATEIGLPLYDESVGARYSTRKSSRPSDTKIPAERLKDEILAAYHRLKSLEDSEDPENRLKVEAEVREWIGRLIDLSPKELKRMITDLTSDLSLDPKEVRELVSISLNLAASRQGETAAELALAYRRQGGSVTGVIGGWAQQDPSNAFAWLEKNKEALGKDYAKAQEEAVKRSVGRDPALALHELAKVHLSGLEEVARGLAENLHDDASRAAFAEELRSKTPGGLFVSDDLSTCAFSALGRSLSKQSPDESSDTIRSLSPAEAAWVADGVSSSNEALNHAEAWLDWMGKSQSAEDPLAPVPSLLTKWISDDYRAAGEWINRQPQGEFRNKAAANYAGMMAKRFPDTAKDWANTLPEGPEKRRLLEDLK